MDNYKRLTLASCAFARLSVAGIAHAETLRFSIGEDPESLYNVATNSLTADGVINTYLLERLVYFDADGQAQPWLAESWEVSADQKTLTFQLRDGITFHDGTPFNAAAVVHHFDAIRDPNNASPQAAKLGPLNTVEALSENAVQFSFSDPYAPFFNTLAGEADGINSPSAVQAGSSGYGRSPVGTGPFKFESWLRGSEISLVRNDDYHGQVRADAVNQGAPHAERVVLSVISEAGVAQAVLEAGELTGAGLQADTIGQFVDHPDFTTVIDETATNLVFLEFNSAKAPWDNPDMRRAIGYAIDREAAAAAA